jgi:hypothetical protein
MQKDKPKEEYDSFVDMVKCILPKSDWKYFGVKDEEE